MFVVVLIVTIIAILRIEESQERWKAWANLGGIILAIYLMLSKYFCKVVSYCFIHSLYYYFIKPSLFQFFGRKISGFSQ